MHVWITGGLNKCGCIADEGQCWPWRWRRRFLPAAPTYRQRRRRRKGNEEQGRCTLHSHIQLWIDKFNELRRLMFSKDKEMKEEAEHELLAYIDKVMRPSCGWKASKSHRCCDSSNLQTNAATTTLLFVKNCILSSSTSTTYNDFELKPFNCFSASRGDKNLLPRLKKKNSHVHGLE